MRRFRLLWNRARRRLMFLAFRALMRTVGFARARPLGRLFGEMQFWLGFHSRRRYAHDMAVALGRAPGDAAVSSQLREAYRVNTVGVLEVLAMFDRRLDEQALAKACAIEGIEQLRAALDGGRGVILLGAHMGNPMLLAARLATLGFPVSAISRQARMMSAGFFDHGLSLYGVDGIRANDGIRAYGRMLAALRQGGVVCLMIDQGVKHARDGIKTRFLGKDVPLSAGPAQLARHARAPVLPVATTATDPQWRYSIEAPVEAPPGASLEEDFERQVRVTEELVRRNPQWWTWHHRRWRNYPLATAARP